MRVLRSDGCRADAADDGGGRSRDRTRVEFSGGCYKLASNEPTIRKMLQEAKKCNAEPC